MRQPSLRAPFLLLLCLWSGIFLPAVAQLQARFIQVTEVIEDSRGRQIVLNTSLKKPLPAPRFKYLPGSSGETILVADFPGVIWYGASRLIYRVPPGINHIRIGQFQANPPVLRVAITAKNPLLLKHIDFNNQAERLVLKWSEKVFPDSTPSSIPAAISNPEPAPHRIASKTAETPSPESSGNPPESAPPSATAPLQTARVPLPAPGVTRQAPVDNKPAPASSYRKEAVKPKAASMRLERAANPSQPKSDELINTSRFSCRTDSQGLPSLSVSRARTGRKAVEIQLTNSAAISYHSFRLREPERHVIDFDAAPELAEKVIPAVSDNPYLTAVRAGNPGGDKQKARLVLDLTGRDVFVQESLSDDGRQLLLTIDNSGAGITDISVPKGMVVVIDPGHGGSDPGAERDSVQEKELTLKLAKRLQRILKKSGVEAVLTRSDDSFVSLEDRVLITNSKQPDAFISIHINAMETKSDIHGIETYYQTPQSKNLADAIHNALINGLDAPDRNVRSRRFYVINHTPVPAVLAEVGFISHSKERKKLISSEYQSKVANGLARGVMLYLSTDGKHIARKVSDF